MATVSKKTVKSGNYKCPKCKAKMVVTESCEYCRRCGYRKHLEPSNLTKRLFNSER